MKKYWLFTMSRYYPTGGMNDYHSCYDSIIDAMNVYDQHEDRDYPYNWAEILDSYTGKVVKICFGDDGVKSWKDK